LPMRLHKGVLPLSDASLERYSKKNFTLRLSIPEEIQRRSLGL